MRIRLDDKELVCQRCDWCGRHLGTAVIPLFLGILLHLIRMTASNIPSGIFFAGGWGGRLRDESWNQMLVPLGHSRGREARVGRFVLLRPSVKK